MSVSAARPKVSIVLPIYNGERYLSDALDTVDGQTLTDWELIIVNDGSTDNTAAILEQAPPDKRRRVIHQPNLRLAAARNRALAIARGPYVAFLDVDDGWHPAYLARMCAALDQAPEAVAAFSGWQYMDSAGCLLPQTVVVSENDSAQLDHDLFWRNSILPSSLVARNQAVKGVGGFDETLHACADWDLWLRLKAAGPFVPVRQVLMWYRAHAESMTENVADIEHERLRVNAKHLGSLDEPLASWTAARRQAVGFTYFNAALGYLRQHNTEGGKEKIRLATQYWPGLLDQPEFYYELGCAFQPRGLRGSAQGLDLVKSARLIRDILFVDLPSAGASQSPARWGQACLVLARLARNTDQWPAARAYSLAALRHGPAGLRLPALRLLVRSSLPKALTDAAARLRSRAQASKPT